MVGRSPKAGDAFYLAEVVLVVERDVALLRKLPVAHDFGLHEGAELLGRHRHRVDRLVGETLLQRGRSERLGDLAVQAARDVRRQPGGPDDAVPLHPVEALEAELLESWYVGLQRMTLQ